MTQQHLMFEPDRTTLTETEQQHLAECASCRILFADREVPLAVGQKPSESVRNAILGDLKPVKPIASVPQLAILFTAAVALVLALFTYGMGSAGFLALSPMARMLMFSIIGVAAMLFSFRLAQEMIPGSLRRVPLWPIAVGLAVAFFAVVALLFWDVTSWESPKMIHSCLWLGLGAAGVTAAISTLLIRRGAWTDRFSSMVSIGSLSGASALLVLTVHCPILKASHIFLWHGGAILIVMLAAWLVARKYQ